MILTDLWLSNFRNHKKLHIKLKPGVTGIIGDNGSGKSSIIEAIQFLLTGELFNSTKEQALNLDASSGFVAGSFILNNKIGRIERHLEMSKTILKYDGVEYKKSGEVKELWDKLLQLNPEIIKKVIIARQGQIPLLFSGDESIREKIFQKIFLVPPTEKIRAMLWKDYIKQAPPVFPEEDLLALKIAKDQKDGEYIKIQKTIDSLYLLSEEQVDALKARLMYLNRCIDDVGKMTMLNDTLVELQDKQATMKARIVELSSKLSSMNIVHIKTYHTTLVQQKVLYAQKLKIEAELASIIPYIHEERAICRNNIRVIEGNLRDLEDEITITRHDRDGIDAQLTVLRVDGYSAACPTCNHPIDDFDKFVKDLSNVKELKQKIIDDDRNRISDLARLLSGHKEYEKNCAIDDTRKNQLNKQLEQFKNLTFDENQLIKFTDVIKKYEDYAVEYTNLNAKYNDLTHSLITLSNEINTLAEYDADSSPYIEKQEIFNKLTNNTEDQRHYQQLNVAIKVKEVEVKNIAARIKTAEENSKKNKNRNEYVSALNKVYDILHTSQFPRKLILSYADIVTDYLQDNLQLFNMPYTARVSDNFKIELVDDQDRILPAVSGGQEMQVGISLHLALHDLFSQSFPLMIIDEGTSHLDKGNRKAYFDIIGNLKVKNKLKQIIIIDHDPQLSEVVDHVIELKVND